jgi:ABC-type taurine transport system substrate-binding protein
MNLWVAGVPDRTSARSAGGMALWPTEIDVAYHWPPVRSTEREPGRVSTDSINWFTWVVGERRAFCTRAALAKAWRCSAAWRSLRKVARAVK